MKPLVALALVVPFLAGGIAVARFRRTNPPPIVFETGAEWPRLSFGDRGHFLVVEDNYDNDHVRIFSLESKSLVRVVEFDSDHELATDCYVAAESDRLFTST